MCYVTNQIDRFLANEDYEEARIDYIRSRAEEDGMGKYLQEAMETISQSELIDEDFEILCETGDMSLISPEGQVAIRDRAWMIGDNEGWAAYEE